MNWFQLIKETQEQKKSQKLGNAPVRQRQRKITNKCCVLARQCCFPNIWALSMFHCWHYNTAHVHHTDRQITDTSTHVCVCVCKHDNTPTSKKQGTSSGTLCGSSQHDSMTRLQHLSMTTCRHVSVTTCQHISMAIWWCVNAKSPKHNIVDFGYDSAHQTQPWWLDDITIYQYNIIKYDMMQSNTIE